MYEKTYSYTKKEALYELARRKQFEDWRRNPLLWLEERLGEPRSNVVWSEVSPLYEEHEWDGDKDPLAQAWLYLGNSYKTFQQTGSSDSKYVAIESATGTGKTYWLARLVFWFLDCFDNSLVITSAPSDAQLKLGLWAELSLLFPKIKKLRPKAAKWKTRLAMETVTINPDGTPLIAEQKERMQTESWHAVAFTTGVAANEESSNKARGFHRKSMLIILEECTGIPLPILTAFQNTSTGNTNYIVAVGNPDNEFDTLHQFSQQPDCFSLRVSAFDHPNIVLGKEYISGAVTQSSINSRTENYGENSPIWNAMVRGISPAQASDSLIKREWLEQCINTDYEDEIGSFNAVGVDVANSTGGDKAATAWGMGNNLMRVDEFQCENATHLAYNLLMNEQDLKAEGYHAYNIPTIYDYDISTDCIGVDAVGVGVATVNAFADRGIEVQSLQGGQWKEAIPTADRWEAGNKKEEPMWRFQTLRSQMYWEFREDVRNKRINIKIEGNKKQVLEIIKELCIPKVSFNSGSISLESKEDIKKRMNNKSPNRADAIVYWNWVRKGYRAKRFSLPAISGGS